MVQQPRSHLVLKSLQVHEQLPLVVIGTAGIDGFLPGSRILGDNGLKRVCTPLLQRLRRLHVIVSVNQDGLRGADVLIAEDYGVTGRLVDGGLVCARLLKQFHKTVGTAAHIGLVLRPGADGRNPQQRKKFFKETLLVLLDVLLHIVSIYVIIPVGKVSVQI